MPCQEQIGDKSSKQNTCSNEHSLDKEEKTDLTSLSGQENECETEVTSDNASNYSCSQSKLTSGSTNCCSNQSKVSSQSGDHFPSQSKFSSQPCDINISQSHTDKTAVTEDGVLHYFFRKHVKPKKQHEIYHLAKVSDCIPTEKPTCSYRRTWVLCGLFALSVLLICGQSSLLRPKKCVYYCLTVPIMLLLTFKCNFSILWGFPGNSLFGHFVFHSFPLYKNFS